MASGSGGGRSVIAWPHFHAKPLMFMAVLLHLLGSGRASYHLPEDAQNGLYVGSVDENGEKQLKYLGNGTTPSGCSPAALNELDLGALGIDIGGPGRKLLQRPPGDPDGLNCGLPVVVPLDVVVATACLANYFGDGRGFYDTIVFRANNVYAFGCDYSENGGQYATANTIWQDNAAVNHACGGWVAAGSAAHSDVDAEYGRQPSTLTDLC